MNISVVKLVSIVLVPLLSIVFVFNFTDLDLSGKTTLSLALIMAGYWISEAIPIAATAILPLSLFPLLNVSTIKETSTHYSHPIVFLFFGGFLLAVAMQTWNLHRRVALCILYAFPKKHIILAFMISAAIISMWVTNTATTMMLLPIAISIIDLDDTSKLWHQGLLLALAYGATLGGLGTLVGTVPNALYAAFMAENYNHSVSLLSWMATVIPLLLLLLIVLWVVLRTYFGRVENSVTSSIGALLTELGPMKREEKIVATLMGLTSLCWILRPQISSFINHAISDTEIVIFFASACFFIPSKSGRILNTTAISKIPWETLLLFGGGLALAAAIKKNGVANWIGDLLVNFLDLHPFLVVTLVIFAIIFLTELTSNIATTATFLPIIATLADNANINPQTLLMPMTISASCAFMLPVATPPNAIIFGSHKVDIKNMMKVGFILNIVLGLITSAYFYLI